MEIRGQDIAVSAGPFFSLVLVRSSEVFESEGFFFTAAEKTDKGRAFLGSSLVPVYYYCYF